ncbi:hypothetical protein AD997_15390 [Erwinia amylovora]|nr:hypothetical protein AD997_15390 [Erwinia amylovora]
MRSIAALPVTESYWGLPLHLSASDGVGCFRSPRSLTFVSSRGCAQLPPCQSLKAIGDYPFIFQRLAVLAAFAILLLPTVYSS